MAAGNSGYIMVKTDGTTDIPNGSVTKQQQANIANGVILGRTSAGSGVIEELGVTLPLQVAAGNLLLTVGSVPLIKNYNSAAGLTGANALPTFTTAGADSTYVISANININSVTLASFQMTCSYTDETNTARTLILNFSQINGTFVQTLTNALGAGAYEGVPLHIRTKASSTIIFATTGTFTTVTYRMEAMAIQYA